MTRIPIAFLFPYLLWMGSVSAQTQLALPDFDFTQTGSVTGWQAIHDLGPLEGTAEGMVATITGLDPYLHGPPMDYPEETLLWMRIRLKSDVGGTGQLFYFDEAATEARSVRFEVPGKVWHEALVPMPALGADQRLRIDPPGASGGCVIQRVWFEQRRLFEAPEWPTPKAPVLGPEVVSIESGSLRLWHNRTQMGGFTLEVDGELAAVGHTAPLIGYEVDHQIRWFAPQESGEVDIQRMPGRRAVMIQLSSTDADGARWSQRQTFSASTEDGSIEMETTWVVDSDRAVLYLPVFTILPGVASYGTNKNQGLFAGVEYLEDEPSSSEADLVGPASWRLVPDRVKLTMPLMAIQVKDHYLGLAWTPQPHIAAVYDSPDRQFNSSGHLFGLLYPGSDGANREERSLLPYYAQLLRAEEPLTVRATLLGGRGYSVVPALKHYVRLKGLPALPATMAADDYFRLIARGWLDSRIREGDLYRHAVWPGFDSQPAADAALWMRWLALQRGLDNDRPRLEQAAGAALARIAPAIVDQTQISHNRYPLPSLVFGGVMENAEMARERGWALCERFDADGSVLYQSRAGGLDYAKTHYAREANGLTAQVIRQLLEAAIVCGDPALLEAGLRHLRALDKYRNTVPRGAQTWEIPLHTPDILASAHLVQAYTIGYELTGDDALLEQARYWAWTGVPFVYLVAPTPQEVGCYSTIAVLGATSWKAPVWLGQPVQWCGLVYADALLRLARQDTSGPWEQLASGIAGAGIQHTWRASDPERMGLLPDFFLLKEQRSDGPAINPGTLFPVALSHYGRPSPYEFWAFRQHGWLLHVPGELHEVDESAEGVSFVVRPWPLGRSWLLVNGVRALPAIRMNGRTIEVDRPHEYRAENGRLLIGLDGSVKIEIVRRP